MKKIYKYPLKWQEANTVVAPIVRPLCVTLQHEVPTFYAEVDLQLLDKPIRIYRVGTGNIVPSGLVYLNTIEYRGYVWHFYIEVHA